MQIRGEVEDQGAQSGQSAQSGNGDPAGPVQRREPETRNGRKLESEEVFQGTEMAHREFRGPRVGAELVNNV